MTNDKWPMTDNKFRAIQTVNVVDANQPAPWHYCCLLSLKGKHNTRVPARVRLNQKKAPTKNHGRTSTVGRDLVVEYLPTIWQRDLPTGSNCFRAPWTCSFCERCSLAPLTATRSPSTSSARRRLTIVGVAGDVRIKAIEASVEPTVYTSLYQVESGATTSAVFILRTATANPARLASAVRDALWSVDRALPVFDIRTMEQIVAGSLATRRFAMALLVSFAGLALGLAVIGLYAVLSYAVAQRMPELGLRLALGATPTSLISLVVGQGLRLAAAGVILGMLTGCAAATAMSKLLFGVKPLDPMTFGAVGTLLLCVALAASYVPARRASRVDPLVALRYE